MTEQRDSPDDSESTLRPKLSQEEPDTEDLNCLIPRDLRSKVTKGAATILYKIVSEALDKAADEKWELPEQSVLIESSSLMYSAFPHALSIIANYNKNDGDELLIDIEKLMLEAYILGALVIESPFFERLHREELRAQTQHAREKRSIPPVERRAIVASRAQYLWRKNPLRNGNASGTTQDILDDVNNDLTAAGKDAVSERTIRRDLPMIPGWQPRSTTVHE
jgi:hypothetical protein